MNLKLKSMAFILFSFIVLSGLTSRAQTSKGAIVGVVRDQSDAAIAKANVTVTNEQTGETRTVISNDRGEYQIEAIGSGLYTLKAESAGFATQNVTHLKVNPSVSTSFDLVLAVARENTSVTVQANTNTINTDNGELSGTIDSSELRNLPIFTLNPVELATTIPGVQIVMNGGLSNGVNLAINGARPRANNYLIDGADINDTTINGQAIQPNIPDMYASETVLTNSYTAEYGRGGGGIVNLITAGGTNLYHGTVWDLYSGSGLNAFDGQTRQFMPTHADRARFNQHQIGFTAGGPVFKNKLFAFGATQWSRLYGKEQPGVITLPDAGGYATLRSINTANSQLLQQFLGGGAYLNTFLTKSNGPTSTQAVNPADCPGGNPCNVTFAKFSRPAPQELSPDTQWTFRIDYLPRSQDSINFRYLHDRSTLTPDFFNEPFQFPGFDTQQGGPSELATGAWTHVFTQNLLNEFRVSMTRISFFFDLTPEALANPLAQIPTISIGGISGLVPIGAIESEPQGRAFDLYQFQDTVSYTHGIQTWRIGFDVAQQIEKDVVPFNIYGTLGFNTGGGFTALGNFLDNYLGPSGAAAISSGTQRVDPHAFRQAYFAELDLKLLADLTVNLGLRYEYQHNPENALKYPALNPNDPFAPIDTIFKVAEDENNFGPRIGLAYSPHTGNSFFNDGKIVYHAGWGIFYDILFTNIVQNSAEGAPNVFSGTLTSTQGRGLANATSLIPSIEPVLSPFSTEVSVTNNLVNPLTQQWNIGFERQLPANIKWTLNYVGSRGEKLFANQQYNYFQDFSPTRLNPDRGAILARGNFADSIYHSLQTEVSHDFSHGFLVRGTWTYGKLLDDGDEVFNIFNQPTGYAANLAPGGRAGEWGNSGYDHRNYLSIAYIWALPGAHSSNSGMDVFLSAATRHWTVSGITQFQSGPYTTWNFAGIDSNGDGSSFNDRPIQMNAKASYNAVGIDTIYVDGSTPGKYYDLYQLDTTAAEVLVDPRQQHFLIPYGRSGNVRRDSYPNPGTQLWNLALQKNIPVHLPGAFESAAFQLRCEAQDVGNHNNVGPLDLNLLDVGTSTYLSKSTARDQDFRSLRFWVKFTF
jgi:outer membrane receptor protein involved in Fe transport